MKVATGNSFLGCGGLIGYDGFKFVPRRLGPDIWDTRVVLGGGWTPGTVKFNA